MGTSDSSCCGQSKYISKRDKDYKGKRPIKQQDKQPFVDPITGGLYTSDPSGEQTKDKDAIDPNDDDHKQASLEMIQIADNDKKDQTDDKKDDTIPACLLNPDDDGSVEKCDPLNSIIVILNEYHEWIDDVIDDKYKNIDSIEYNQYYLSISKLISSQSCTSLQLNSFIDHIVYAHGHGSNINSFDRFSSYCIDGMTRNKNKAFMSAKKTGCDDDNCFSMKYKYLRNKDKEDTYDDNKYLIKSGLYLLSFIHCYMFHTVHFSEYLINGINRRATYSILCYYNYNKRKYLLKKNKYKKHYKSICGKDCAINVDIRIMRIILLYSHAKFIEEDDALDSINAATLANWISETMNSKTLNRIWSKFDSSNDGGIDKDELDDVLFTTTVIMVAVKSQTNKGAQIEKSEIRAIMKPVGEFIKQYRMDKHPVISKEEFRDIFPKWLMDYHESYGGINADKDLENYAINKYINVIDDDNNPNVIDNIKDNVMDIGDQMKNGLTNLIKSSKDKAIMLGNKYIENISYKYDDNVLVYQCEYLHENKDQNKHKWNPDVTAVNL